MIHRGGFYENEQDEGKSRKTYATRLSIHTNSGIDDLGGEAFYVVGVRGRDSVTNILPEFRSIVPHVRKKWRYFVEPVEKVPNDAYVGIVPHGSREQPYYLPTKWGSPPVATGRILENGTGSCMPEYVVQSYREIPGLKTIIYEGTGHEAGSEYVGYPYKGMWNAAVRHLPEGANAIAFGSSQHVRKTIEFVVRYYSIEISSEPFYFLTQCGDRFFTQYSGLGDLTEQPHVLVERARIAQVAQKICIPAKTMDMTYNEKQYWPILACLSAHAPEGVNAVYMKKVWGDNERGGYATCSYYHVTLGEKAFRPFTEIRRDFDWQLQRRIAAQIL